LAPDEKWRAENVKASETSAARRGKIERDKSALNGKIKTIQTIRPAASIVGQLNL
jgi:hypothetical protein